MTQHQAPEVTSELASCPFCGDDGSPEGSINPMAVSLVSYEAASGHEAWHVECGCGAKGSASYLPDRAITAWNTRATQPLSLTVDEAWLRDCLADLLRDHDPSCGSEDCLSAARKIAPLLLDRLQSLSLPVDIDRSGLAQEVES